MIKAINCECRATSIFDALLLWHLNKNTRIVLLTWTKSPSVFPQCSLSLSHSLCSTERSSLTSSSPSHPLSHSVDQLRKGESACVKPEDHLQTEEAERACTSCFSLQGKMMLIGTIDSSQPFALDLSFCALNDIHLQSWEQTKSPPVRVAEWCVILLMSKTSALEMGPSGRLLS